MDSKLALDVLSALSHDTRLSIFRLLVKAGSVGLPAGQIGEQLGVRQNTLSSNLSVLTHAQLLISQREGRSIRYFVDLGTMRHLLAFLMEDCCGAKPELCQPLIAQLACQEGCL